MDGWMDVQDGKSGSWRLPLCRRWGIPTDWVSVRTVTTGAVGAGDCVFLFPDGGQKDKDRRGHQPEGRATGSHAVQRTSSRDANVSGPPGRQVKWGHLPEQPPSLPSAVMLAITEREVSEP